MIRRSFIATCLSGLLGLVGCKHRTRKLKIKEPRYILVQRHPSGVWLDERGKIVTLLSYNHFNELKDYLALDPSMRFIKFETDPTQKNFAHPITCLVKEHNYA